jgi:phosphoribosylanthranilate isomerase
MVKTFIKICGLRCPEQAFQTAKLGANFIGVVFHPPSKRYVSTTQAKEIVEAAKKGGALTAGIFVNQNADEMAQIIDEIKVQLIQLNGDICKQQHHLLSDQYTRIFVLTASECNINLPFCDKNRDFLLFDHPNAGGGQSFDWRHFNYTGCFRWGLAGGLTAHNVQQAKRLLKPHLLDVSTGVENALGEKDLNLIKQFIRSSR